MSELKVRDGGKVSVPRTTGRTIAEAERNRPSKVSINFQVPRSLRDEFSELADKHDVNMSKFLRKQVEKFVSAARAGVKRPVKAVDFQFDLDAAPTTLNDEAAEETNNEIVLDSQDTA